MNGRDNLVIRGTVLDESPRAWKVQLEGHAEEQWLPKSQVEAYSNETMFSIPRWLAREKDLL